MDDDYDYVGGWDEGEEDSFDNDRGFRNNRYRNAYGDYRGGYGPAPFNQGPPGPPGPLFPPGPFFGPPQGFSRRQRNMPPPPTTILGRGYGPNGPGKRAKENPAIRYLVRCGLPKHTLKGLPNNLLDQIEPQYCGLCGQQFESFALSRIHYVSKNHQKAQKKFLSNMGSGVSQESGPLRARELYCELCDVQITSKVHAESHYKGKSHHAVVEGRKNPKNPILLQHGMQRRLQQLIRREKKFLNKPTEATEPEEVEVKDVKPVAPELYCEICKTNVTCSEQMTAHLNGKRHLIKEKNFILKSMRGEIDVKQEVEDNTEADNTAGDYEGDDTGADDALDSENPEGAAAKDDDDWQEHWE